MHNHINDFIHRANIPQQAKDYLLDSTDSFMQCYSADLHQQLDIFYNNNFDVPSTLEKRNYWADELGISVFTVNFIFLVSASLRMKHNYHQTGISEEIYWDTILDIQYKLAECYEVDDVWGVSCETWYSIFFRLDLFKLGRLEFERSVYNQHTPYDYNGGSVHHGDRAYSVHIPSAGKLEHSLCIDSYKRAYEFFKHELNGAPLVCVCSSWLMYYKNEQIFQSNSNLAQFANDWAIVSGDPVDNFYDSWRVFGKHHKKDIDQLPTDTTLRKSIAEWLQSGNKMGVGYGVLVFDGERFL